MNLCMTSLSKCFTVVLDWDINYALCKVSKADVHVFKRFARFTVLKSLFKKNTLAQVLFCKFCSSFMNTYFEENWRAVASRVLVSLSTFLILKRKTMVCPFDVQTFKIHLIQNEATSWKKSE